MATISCPRVISVGDRLHDPLLNLLLFMTAMISAVEKVAGRLANNQPRKEGDTLAAMSRVANRQVIFPAHGPLEGALDGKPPKDIPIILRSGLPKGEIRDLAKLPGYMDTMVAALFVYHFEQCHDWLKANKKDDTVHWSMPLKFGAVVRNALAHGGKIKIDPPRQGKPPRAPVTWCGLTYSTSDNGNVILGTDLYGADLVALMIEVDDAAVELGAPL